MALRRIFHPIQREFSFSLTEAPLPNDQNLVNCRGSTIISPKSLDLTLDERKFIWCVSRFRRDVGKRRYGLGWADCGLEGNVCPEGRAWDLVPWMIDVRAKLSIAKP